jgi:cystathionine gamma-synthase
VAYEEGEPWIVRKMKCGYPRFFVHPIIHELATEVVKLHGNTEEEAATLFPSPKTASVCRSFILSRIPSEESQRIRIVNFVTAPHTESRSQTIRSRLSCVIYPAEYTSIAKQVWQHSGNGISSRRGEFCLSALRDGFLVEDKEPAQIDQSSQKYFKGPRRYQGRGSANGIVRGGAVHSSAADLSTENTETQDDREYVQFIEERFGRNLSVLLADQAKQAVRRRIAGVLTANVDLSEALDETS